MSMSFVLISLLLSTRSPPSIDFTSEEDEEDTVVHPMIVCLYVVYNIQL